MERPAYRYHDLLVDLRPPVKEDMTKKFKAGQAVHAKLEAIIGEVRLVEREGRYSDPDLPYDILYHPDIVREEPNVKGTIETHLYEIKPLIWFVKNRRYCEVQAAGYLHFTGAAQGDFVLYQSPEDDPKRLTLSLYPLRRIPWEHIKPVLRPP